jgi:caffeoyl-CoA O-methyltransferase
MKAKYMFKAVFLFAFILGASTLTAQQIPNPEEELDEKVRQFLEENKKGWRDLNVPFEDGKVLYDIIIKNNYRSALEIGTSTGHSTVWIAWALSKTGGKLVTVEIDEERQREAIRNLEKVGLSDIVEFRLGDAHEIVKEVQGPFDFVFSDADKTWYVQYFKDVDPKLKQGGCFTAHNVLQNQRGIAEYLDYVNSLSGYTTTMDRSSSSGISISYKK